MKDRGFDTLATRYGGPKVGHGPQVSKCPECGKDLAEMERRELFTGKLVDTKQYCLDIMCGYTKTIKP